MADQNDSAAAKFKRDKVLNTVTLGLFALGILCVGYVLISNFMRHRESQSAGNLDCVKTTSVHNTSDAHMSGIVEQGNSFKVLENFYNCNNAQRGDLVWFKFSDQIEPVPRILRGLPGDKYSIQQESTGDVAPPPNNKVKGKVANKPDPTKITRWKISINGQLVKVGDQEYFIESNTIPPLKTYEISRGGVLGADEYILLSSRPPGLSDSSNLGLISKKALAGKVMLTK